MADEPNPDAVVEPVVDPAAPVAVTSIAFDDLKTAGLPDTFFTDKGLDAAALAASITEGATLKAAAEERAKAVPADGKYDFGLPKDWKAPGGLDAKGFEWTFPDEMASKFSERAKAKGMSQADVSEFVSDWAAGDLAKKSAAAKATKDASTAEMAKLGTGAAGRLSAIDSFLGANLGKDAAIAITRELTTAASIQAVEKLIGLANGSKMAPNAGAGDGLPTDHTKNAELAGKPGGGRKLLEAAHAAKN